MQRPSESEVVDPRMMPTSFDQPRDPIDLKQAVWRWDPAHSVRSKSLFVVFCCLFRIFSICSFVVSKHAHASKVALPNDRRGICISQLTDRAADEALLTEDFQVTLIVFYL